MPIEVTCGGCERRLRVPDKTAGKKIKCPKCSAVIQVPEAIEVEEPIEELPDLESSPLESPADESPPATGPESWFLKTDEGEDYGPVSRAELDVWAAEGRLNADCQVLQEGADQWQWATDLYPQLDPQLSAAGAAADTAGAAGAGVAGAEEGELSDKRKLVAALLALICLGGFGVHRFYLGYTTIGILQIVVTLVTCGVGAWWGVVEGILILVGKIDRDAQGRLLRD